MKDIIIKSYIKSLTKYDIKMYAEKNNIILNDKELDYIYFNIKENYKDILSNPNKYLEIIKSKFDNITYQKIYELYTKYYPKLYH